MNVSGACILGCAGPGLGRGEAAFFRNADPFGFILFGRNVETPDQLRRLCGDLRSAVGRDAPILIDQEGGRVQRLGPPHWRQWRPALDEVARIGDRAGDRAGDGAARVMYLRSRLIARELRDVGIDVNCAPVADVATGATHPVLRNRCYSDDAGEVMKLASSVAAGLMAGGVLPVVKHMPGHGRAVVDSHLELPRTDAPLSVLERSDFRAFAPLSHLPMGMTSHVVYDALDPGRPGTLSPVVQRHIREKLKFGGLVMTDDISMEALSGSLVERGRAALSAGVDVILHCNGRLDEMEELCAACGALSPAGQKRAQAALDARRDPDDIDIAAVEAEFEALTGAHDDV